MLTKGDISSNGQVLIVDEDRLCYLVKSVSRGAVGFRTISKALLKEYIAYLKVHPYASPSEIRSDLCGKRHIDKFE